MEGINNNLKPQIPIIQIEQNSKTADFANSYFDALYVFITFPVRYLGSKSWSLIGLSFRVPYQLFAHYVGTSDPSRSLCDDLFGTGYTRFGWNSLGSEEMKNYLFYGAAANTAHGNEESWIEPFGYRIVKPSELYSAGSQFPVNVEMKDTCFFDTVTGLKIFVLTDGNEIVLSFGAQHSFHTELECEDHKKDIQSRIDTTVWKQLLGFAPEFYSQADSMVDCILDHPSLKGKKVTLTGQSFGGSLAQYVALKRDLPAFCINSVMIGPGLQASLGAKKVADASKNVTHIVASGDLIADNMLLVGGIDWLINNVFSIRTPANFGKKLRIPSAYTSRTKTHIYFFGSAMKHLGFSNTSIPSDFSEDEKKQIFVAPAA